ncbi:MAG: lectin-like protein [Eubacterium sp.]
MIALQRKRQKNKGGYLICISSKEENNIVVHYLEKSKQGDTRMWIGLERNQNDISKFKWIDGSELTYTNWERRTKHIKRNKGRSIL